MMMMTLMEFRERKLVLLNVGGVFSREFHYIILSLKTQAHSCYHISLLAALSLKVSPFRHTKSNFSLSSPFVSF
jgi:hypothetical protein